MLKEHMLFLYIELEKIRLTHLKENYILKFMSITVAPH
jgi:hypothetical protein